jgi:hypothetical protein
VRKLGAVSNLTLLKITLAGLFVVGAAAFAGSRYFAGSTKIEAATTDRPPASQAASGRDAAQPFVDLTEKQANSLKSDR